MVDYCVCVILVRRFLLADDNMTIPNWYLLKNFTSSLFLQNLFLCQTYVLLLCQLWVGALVLANYLIGEKNDYGIKINLI